MMEDSVDIVALTEDRANRMQQMVLLDGGTFRMGSDRHYPEEAPVHQVTVGSFWIDRTPVTNRQFQQFVKATGYVTVAEEAADPHDYPGALPQMLKPGSHAGDRQPAPGSVRADTFDPRRVVQQRGGGGYTNDFFAREFWRFVLVQKTVAALAQTAVEFPPMQAPASFNLEAVKRQIEETIKAHEGQ
jgi:hypothetical protein